MRFEKRTVVVTGAAKGIGAAIARAFADEGARVAALDIDAPGLETLARDVTAQGRDLFTSATDVTSAAQVQKAVDAIVARWGGIDVLVNNAGGFSVVRKTEEISDEEWDQILRFNLTSVFLCSRAVLPHMKRQQSGRIVNLSSVVGRAGAVLVTSHYAAAKAGVIGFTRHLAREVGPDGITVNAVAPGTTATERVAALRSAEDNQKIAAAVPLRRLGAPEEIAAAVLFLASDAARYVTGACLDVNGGLVMA